ncbi:MAG: protein-L-isoaspartate O-methyltransferase family protein, partial [Terriglobales bacterium]
MDALERRREFFSRLVTAHVRGGDGQLQQAFQRTPREKFLGPGPWRAFTAAGYLDIPEGDAGLVYQDIPVALAPERGINNGQPSLHALCLAALAPRLGEHVLHIGAGTGYYTAILAHLVGADRAGSGEVDAYELEADLAARATENLAGYPGVRVHARDGTRAGLAAAGIIYVNAGASAPAPAWLASLEMGGRLLFPLTAASGAGAMLLVTRHADATLLEARLLLPVAFIPCVGAQDSSRAAALAAAFERGGWKGVR